jgi:alpha-tubulin suppressor-like RCC1 family protein
MRLRCSPAGTLLFLTLGCGARSELVESSPRETPPSDSGLESCPPPSGTGSVPQGPAIAISVGTGFACALTTAGGVVCWGNNDSGELGNGTTAQSAAPAQVSGLASGVVAVSAGYDSACALTNGGSVWCWGNDSTGQLGDGSTANSSVPVQVTGLGDAAIAVSVGEGIACAATAQYALVCWGDDSSGLITGSVQQDGQLLPFPIVAGPQPVPTGSFPTGVAAVSVGSYALCELTTAGTVLCWEASSFWQSVFVSHSLVPTPVTGLDGGVKGVSAGGSACALGANGELLCWGDESRVPTAVPGFPCGVKSVSVGAGSQCAITAGGAVVCWGTGDHGQLGDGLDGDSSAPVPVAGLTSGVSAVSVGGTSACALTSAGHVWCWGRNLDGELGSETSSLCFMVPCSTVPVPVIGL